MTVIPLWPFLLTGSIAVPVQVCLPAGQPAAAALDSTASGSLQALLSNPAALQALLKDPAQLQRLLEKHPALISVLKSTLGQNAL